MIGVITFGLMALFRLQRPWRDSWDLITDLISYAIGAAIGVVGIGVALLFLGSARAARRSNANGPTRYRVSDGGVAIEDNITTAQLKWPVFAGFADLKSLILMRLKQRRMVLIVPKRCLSDAAEADLIKILSKQLPRLG